MFRSYASAVVTVLMLASHAHAGLQNTLTTNGLDDLPPLGAEDQLSVASQIPTSDALAINSANIGGQVVTTGMAGQLTRVELAVLALPGAVYAQPLWIDIVKLEGDRPDFSPNGRLASRGLDGSRIPLATPTATSWEFNVSVGFKNSNLYFDANEKFAIVLRSQTDPSGGYLWGLNANPLSSAYDAGVAYSLSGRYDLYDDDDLEQLVVSERSDAQFRTYMLAPEPAMEGLMACGLLGLSHRCRRRVRNP